MIFDISFSSFKILAKNGLNPVQAGIGLQRFDVRETVLRFEQFLLNHSAPFLANIELWMVLVTIGFNQIGVKQEHQWKGFCHLLTQMVSLFLISLQFNGVPTWQEIR